jgi:hypothetical protein
MSNVTIFNAESTNVLMYTDAKGRSLSISAEGAIIKGGKTLMGMMKDAALESALTKAMNGKYRAAADILAVGFPKVGKAAESLLGTVWANKTNMATLVAAALRAEAGAKGFSDKQLKARALAKALTQLPAFAEVAPAGDVIEG